MPIYDYHCDHCGHTFSQVQSYADATLEVCPSCAQKPRKLMATPAIVFKGGGWYKTDSRPAQKEGPKEGATEAAKDGAKAGAATARTESGEGGTKTEAASKGDAPKGDRPTGDGAKGDGPQGKSKSDAPKTTKPAPVAPKGEGSSS